ncbi:MAG TPA: crotonase/enoyl-CoA hydratase family protein [Stellaceae bacterium]|nr:crotonase/enoyl-CoA hydratase family protein [Stellaceae bacterium]
MAAPANLIDLAAQRQAAQAREERSFSTALAVQSPASAPNGVAAVVAAQHLSQLRLHYDGDEKILWCQFDYTGRPCFSPQVLNEAQQVQKLVRDLCLAATGAGEEPPLRYLVLNSAVPGVWNLGGDLELFANLIRRRDRAELTRYAHQCCEVGYINATLYQLPVITVALVQGDALGGGFEAAMSSNLVVAERSAKFGLPEVLFNLFPGMGAYTFMARRIAPGLAERMILSGEIFTAEKLHEIGLIDVLAPDGAGVETFYDAIGRTGKRHQTHVALRAARRLVNPIGFEEMARIAELWVEAAFKLEESDLKKMLRLAAAQDRRRDRAPQPD